MHARGPPWGCRSGPDEAGADPARAVVPPPHLPAKTNGFCARMHWPPRAGWNGPHRDRGGASSMHIYALCLCSLFSPWSIHEGSAIIGESDGVGSGAA